MNAKIKAMLKRNRLFMRFFNKYRNHLPINPMADKISIPEITPFSPTQATSKNRINLIVPSINQEHVFGGISTALKFFSELGENLQYDIRIILTDATPAQSDIDRIGTYFPSAATRKTSIEIFPYNDRYQKEIGVSENDVFVSTAWWTAYNAYKTMEWQEETFGFCRPLVYLIQDYEPGFYSWSGKYALAYGTYRSRFDTFAVFNSSFLGDYFSKNDLRFSKSFVFEPRLNSVLAEKLNERRGQVVKEKLILLYGRPSVERNAFSLIIEGLKVWVWKQPDAKEWKIISAGESHPGVDLGNGCVVTSVGKVTIEEYSDLLSRASVGVSLMISPHPSYPPMEMAVYGACVITNGYGNKNLSKWHDNIVSIDNISPEKLSEALRTACDDTRADAQRFIDGKLKHPEYRSTKDQFGFMSELTDSIRKSSERDH